MGLKNVLIIVSIFLFQHQLNFYWTSRESKTYLRSKIGCGESIKDFLALGFRVRFKGGSAFVTSNDLINRGYKTDAYTDAKN